MTLPIQTKEHPMNELIEAIRIAVAEGATPEQKAIGAHACRTIGAALGAEPGTPIAMPGVLPSRPLAGLSLDQALDLVIARLSVVADEREKRSQIAATVAPQHGNPPGLRLPFTPVPTRVPSPRPNAHSPAAHSPARRKP